MEYIAHHDNPVVLEYGLWAYPQWISMLQDLQRLGADPCWFDGDRPTAFAAWRAENLRAGRSFPDSLWHEVVGVIDANWQLIEEFFGPKRIIHTIGAGPIHVPPETIYQSMRSEG
jgi:hypothetical protein